MKNKEKDKKVGEKPKLELEKIVLKTSRVSFLGNYFLAVLVIFFTLLTINVFDLKFVLLPKTQGELFSSFTILALFGIAGILIEQPEWERFKTKYIITYNEVIKEEGIINKHTTSVPYGTVAYLKVDRMFFGRIFNYGNILVSSFKSGSDIEMKGMRDPKKIHAIIQDRVNILREGQLGYFKKPQ